MSALISIIIPIYNAEKMLCSTLDSVVAQTYPYWECILVNDGSVDNSGAICDYYAIKERRFKVFHKQNGGVSTARNLGLDNATGNWITFCDSDDILEPDALEKYMMATEYTNADVIRAGYREVYPDGSIRDIKIDEPVTIEKKSEMLLFMEKSRYFGFLWNSLFHYSTISEIRFADDISWCEDHLFSLQTYIKSQAVHYIPDIVYNYYKHSKDSLSFPNNPYMIVAVANLEYDVKQNFVKNNLTAINDTIILYQSKIVKALGIALNQMTCDELKFYYEKTKEQVKLFDDNHKSKYLNFFYKSHFPFLFRVHLIKFYLTLMKKR